MVSPLPKTCRVAFKEWAGVCDALIEGRQTVIIRKGGISETAGPGEFDARISGILAVSRPGSIKRSRGCEPAANNGPLPIRPARDALDFDPRACDRRPGRPRRQRENSAVPSRSFIFSQPETIFKRFHYRRPGFWILGARVWRGDQAFTLPITREHAGCKTWVALDHPLSTSRAPTGAR